jgi:hypothetical protein
VIVPALALLTVTSSWTASDDDQQTGSTNDKQINKVAQEMHGKGTYFDPRLNDPVRFPVAAGAGFSNVRNTHDLITAKLPALHFYQLALPAPKIN